MSYEKRKPRAFGDEGRPVPIADVLKGFLRSAGLDAAVPHSATNQAEPTSENPVVLEIAGDGSYPINSEAVASTSLHDRLVDIFERRGHRVLFVKAASTLEFSVVATAIDAARGVNIDRVALMPR